jgi:Tol biopolymer transport system component
VTKDEALDRDPDWAPGGKRVVFSRQVAMVFQLFIMKRNGQNLRQVTSTATDVRDPEWSPDGKRILFTALGPFASPDIFSILPSGEDQVNLTGSPEYEGAASWSPDGETIAFARDDQLMIMSADGSGPRPIGVRGNNPKWAPNGRRLIAHRLHESQYQRCFSAKLDGSTLRWLSPKYKQCYSPDWAPRR